MDDELLPEILDDAPEKPAPVRAAESEIRTWGLGLGVAAVVGSLWFWMAVLERGITLPVSWWALYLIGLAVMFFLPPTRSVRLARAILRRWDELRVERALEGAGATSDPEVQVGVEMSSRIVRHPAADLESRESAMRLLHALRVTARDRRTVEVLRQARAAGAMGRDRGERTLSDMVDFLDARSGELLSSLERLHRAVLQRDSEAVAMLRDEAEAILDRLEAERDVERLLGES